MLRKIRSLVSNSDYFGVYDKALSDYECELIVNIFEKSPQRNGIVFLSGSDIAIERPEYKKSKELIDTRFSDGKQISNILNTRLGECLQKYNLEQPQLTTIATWTVANPYNVQKYDGEEEGYKDWHMEHGPHAGQNKRIMAWMFYLNDAKSGTEFMNYPTVQAKRGRCVIWPAGWTHVHRGVTPNKGLKYIATGWVHFVSDE